MTKILEINSCMDCPHHKLLSDPDPSDWFCDDDVKVMCTLLNRSVAVACRPYQARRDTTPPPKDCPLKEVTP